MTSRHKPVLLQTVVHLLKDARSIVDCTINGGGHSIALLESSERPLQLLGTDRDPVALQNVRKRLSKWDGVTLMHGDFGTFDEFVSQWGIGQIDGVLADFGLSSNQLDDPDRGFSYRYDSPLDMRYDQTEDTSADDIINCYQHKELTHILYQYGEERNAGRIAAAIVRSRPIRSTSHLADVIRGCCPNRFIEKTLARVFMAVRVALSGELEAIEKLLPAAFKWLKPGGRMIFISYDSSEDRLVKQFIRRKAQGCICPPQIPVCQCNHHPELKDLTPRIIRPEQTEINTNPRSRAAKLRAAEKLPIQN